MACVDILPTKSITKKKTRNGFLVGVCVCCSICIDYLLSHPFFRVNLKNRNDTFITSFLCFLSLLYFLPLALCAKAAKQHWHTGTWMNEWMKADVLYQYWYHYRWGKSFSFKLIAIFTPLTHIMYLSHTFVSLFFFEIENFVIAPNNTNQILTQIPTEKEGTEKHTEWTEEKKKKQTV